jgi:hypothetical protein
MTLRVSNGPRFQNQCKETFHQGIVIVVAYAAYAGLHLLTGEKSRGSVDLPKLVPCSLRNLSLIGSQ